MRIPVKMALSRSATGWARPAAGWRGVLAAGTAVVIAAWGAWAPVSGLASASARLPAASLTETFGYVGPVAQAVIVPAGASAAEVRVVGGKGGTTETSGRSTTGGDGAQVSGRIAVTPGQVLTLKVAGHGGDPGDYYHPGEGGWGATGDGGQGGINSGATGDGAGGGGASGLEVDGHTVVTAGGGGGAGGWGVLSFYYHGGPGGSSGATADPGHNGDGPGAGKGGGGAANGQPAGGGGGDGSSFAGGGGGGGAGFTGGAGGSGGALGGGGGGGGGAGSSHYTSRLVAPAVVRGSTSDGNGLIFITWNEVSAPVCLDQDVQVPLSSPGVPVRLRCTDTSRVTSFRILTRPEHGFLQMENLFAGTFLYIPEPGYIGTDSLTFQALFRDAVSATYTVTFIVRATTPMHLDASERQLTQGQPLVLTVFMPMDATGQVEFHDLHNGELQAIGTAPIVEGVAILTTSSTELDIGLHHIHASYGGDDRYAPGDSNVVIITVRAP
jgi:hypothetical protein